MEVIGTLPYQPPAWVNPYNGHTVYPGTLEVPTQPTWLGPRMPTPGAQIGRVEFDGRVYQVEVRSRTHRFNSTSGVGAVELEAVVLSDMPNVVTGTLPTIMLYREGEVGQHMFIQEISMNAGYSANGIMETTMRISASGTAPTPSWAMPNQSFGFGWEKAKEFLEGIIPERPLTMKELWAD